MKFSIEVFGFNKNGIGSSLEGKPSSTVYAEYGENLLNVLQRNGFDLNADCGGKQRCLKCGVIISPQIESDCKALIAQNDYDKGIRLACCVSVTCDLIVTKINRLEKIEYIVSPETEPQKDNKFYSKKTLLFAVDVGTTTVALSLVSNGAIISSESFYNPQCAFGADVVSRIQSCNEGNLHILQRELVESILNSANNLARTCNSHEKLFFISGNTVMLHILAGVEPKSIGLYPYQPVFTEKRFIALKSRGDEIFKAMLFPSISGYIGGDIVSGLVFCRLKEKPLSLFIDLGTNGEMAIFNGKQFFAASASAGPAFEGSSISCGAYASNGVAKNASVAGGRIVLDDENATGISGNGIISVVDCLLKLGELDSTGMVVHRKNGLSYTDGKETYIRLGKNLVLKESDIRNVQTAKAAIATGIEYLLRYGGVQISDIHEVLVSGGFSESLDFNACCNIGLFPCGIEKICKPVGNTSLQGAVMCVSEFEKQNSMADGEQFIKNVIEKKIERLSFFEEASEIISKCKVIELSNESDFLEVFTKNLYFKNSLAR